MKSKYVSAHCIGWSFGLMAAGSYPHAYHSKALAAVSALFLVVAVFIADFSGPRDPR